MDFLKQPIFQHPKTSRLARIIIWGMTFLATAGVLIVLYLFNLIS